MSSTRFEPEGSSSGRRMYMWLRYDVFYVLKLQQKAVIIFVNIKYFIFLNMLM
jgi:hypothetical protein